MKRLIALIIAGLAVIATVFVLLGNTSTAYATGGNEGNNKCVGNSDHTGNQNDKGSTKSGDEDETTCTTTTATSTGSSTTSTTSSTSTSTTGSSSSTTSHGSTTSSTNSSPSPSPTATAVSSPTPHPAATGSLSASSKVSVPDTGIMADAVQLWVWVGPEMYWTLAAGMVILGTTIILTAWLRRKP